uniref:G_PROTEIN_RECEP_F1_2 domain-containing protein n=2 Tax=Meloidogyne incognita TaxID=6306 RepID=A0A914KP21_MELIC
MDEENIFYNNPSTISSLHHSSATSSFKSLIDTASLFLFEDSNIGSNPDPVINTSVNSTSNSIINDTFDTDAEGGGALSKCLYDEPPLTKLRFVIVTCIGTSIALCSILENSFFFYLFSTRKHHRHSFNCYMMFIALFDILISSSYIFLMSMNVLMDFLQSLTLFRIWHYYMVPMITVSHCAITSGSFLILAATIERFFLTANSRYIRVIQRNRKYVILFAILMGILSKVTICLEFKISYRNECADTMSEIDIGFADFVFDTDYHLYFRFYYRNFVTIFFPFFALLFLNFKIIHVLARYEKENYQFQLLNSSTATAKQIKRKKITRAATITTILVVCTYLVSNIISVALTTWEHIDKDSLMSDYLQFYLISIDLTSFLVLCACAFRPNIYLICQPALRKEVFLTLKRAFRMNDDFGGLDPRTELINVFEPMYNSFVCSKSDNSNIFCGQLFSLESSLPLHTTAHDEKRASYAESIKKRLSIPSLKSASPFHLAKRFSIQQMRRDSINPPNGHSPPNGQCAAGQIKEEEDEDNIEETQQQQPALPPYYRRSSIGQNIVGGNYPSPLSHLERLSEEREDSSSQPSTPATIGAISRKSTRIEMCLGKGELVRSILFSGHETLL